MMIVHVFSSREEGVIVHMVLEVGFTFDNRASAF